MSGWRAAWAEGGASGAAACRSPSAPAPPGPRSRRTRPPRGLACPARHCWVADAADGRGVKRPGLLVEWRETDGRWQGRVVYVGLLRGGAWALVEEWVPADLLTPS